MRYRGLPLLAAALLAAAPAAAQSVRGTVVDSASRLPLAGAAVTVLDLHGATVGHRVTGVDGAFTFALPAFGDYRVRAIRIGYAGRITEPIVVDSLYAYSVELALRPNPVRLDTLRVVAEKVTVEKQVPWLAQNGFYDRRREGFGHFLTREEIERKIPVTVYDVFVGIPGFHVACQSISSCGISTTRGRMFLLKGCTPKVFLDGVPMAGSLADISPLDVEAVEAYASPAGLPVQYAGYLSPCGAILIWTRH